MINKQNHVKIQTVNRTVLLLFSAANTECYLRMPGISINIDDECNNYHKKSKSHI